MRYIFVAIILFCTLLFIPSFSQVHAAERSIRITSPNGGETFKEGDKMTITWDSSANIDKVSIGWSSGPGSLNWIGYNNVANTKSVSWTVDVGNTTNTQFQMYIIGYETGVGSTTDTSDNYFTINQYPPAPTATSTTQPQTPSSTKTSTTRSSTPAPTSQNFSLTVSTLTLWSVFYFNGSTTTDIKQVTNPQSVEDFTLDTQSGYKFVFTNALNLTNQQTLQGLSHLQDGWVIEEWSVWFHEEWWETYDIRSPIEVHLKNSALTAYPPLATNDIALAANNKKVSAPQILPSKTGEAVVKVSGPTKLALKPHVTMSGEKKETVKKQKYAILGKSSHNNLLYYIRLNGSTLTPLMQTSFDKKTGSFQAKEVDLTHGANFIQLYVAQKEGDTPTLMDEKTVNYSPQLQPWMFAGVLAVMAGAYLVLKNKIFIWKQFLHFKDLLWHKHQS